MANTRDATAANSFDAGVETSSWRGPVRTSTGPMVTYPPTSSRQSGEMECSRLPASELRLDVQDRDTLMAGIISQLNSLAPMHTPALKGSSPFASPFGAPALQLVPCVSGTRKSMADTCAFPFPPGASPFSAAASEDLHPQQPSTSLDAHSSHLCIKRARRSSPPMHTARLNGRTITFVRCLGQGSLGHEVHLGDMEGGQQVAVKISTPLPLCHASTTPQFPPTSASSSASHLLDFAFDLHSSSCLGAPCFHSGAETYAATSPRGTAPLDHEASIAALLAAHPHPNIVQYLGTAELEGEGCSGQSAIVMELCAGGNLLRVIHGAHREGRAASRKSSAQAAATGASPPATSSSAPPSLERQFFGSWRLRVDVLRGVARGLAHMHSLGVAHGDVTSYNVLLSKGCEPKLCDFDHAHATRAPIVRTGAPHSLLWQPAEHVLGCGPYDGAAADVHCFGILMFEVVTLCVPHTAREDEAHEWDPCQLAAHSVGRLCDTASDPLEHMPRTLEQLWPRLPASLPREQQADVFERLTMLARKCCAPEPTHRPGMEQVVCQLEQLCQLLASRSSSAGVKDMCGKGHVLE